MAITTSILTGIITSALYDLSRNHLPAQLRQNFPLVYDKAIKEVSQTYEKNLKPVIKQIFKDAYIKDQIKKFRGGRATIIDNVKSRAKDIVTEKYWDLPLSDIIDDFYSIFLRRIGDDPKLSTQLEQIYNSIMVDHLLALQNTVGRIDGNVQDIKDKLINDVKDKSYVKIVQESGFPRLLGGFQIRLINQDLSAFLQNLDNHPFEGKDGFKDVEKINKDEYSTTYIPKDSSNEIRLEHNGKPFKIIYPPSNSVDIWIKQKNNYLEVTCFTGSYALYKELLYTFKHCCTGKSYLGKMTFDRKMKQLIRKHIGQITTIEYDPLIWGKIEVEGIITDLTAHHATISGEKGIMKHETIQDLIKSLKRIRPNQIADIYFFKAEGSAKFDKKYNTTFDVHHNGRIIAFFNKRRYTDSDMKDSIYTFIIENGNLLSE